MLPGESVASCEMREGGTREGRHEGGKARGRAGTRERRHEEVRGRSDALERKLEAVTKQLLEQQQQGGTSPSKVSFSSGKGARRTRE